MLSCASLHKPSLANLSSLILSAPCCRPKELNCPFVASGTVTSPGTNPLPLSRVPIVPGCLLWVHLLWDSWWLVALSIVLLPSILGRAPNKAQQCLCAPASQMRRDQIKEGAEALAYLAFPSWYHNLREEGAVSVQGIQLLASYTAPATGDKVMLSQPTALCSVCNTILTSCHVIQWSQTKTLTQNNQRGVWVKMERWEEFSDARKWPQRWLSPSFTTRVCDKGPSTLEMSHQYFLLSGKVFCSLLSTMSRGGD